mmetsp:Transcript_115200/g.279527  ORF Transcript_115200/g.279527 Transcript_115200/m.279527 type:complete len:279 (+) Transcript_115200:569-1405(+)
MPAVLDPSTAYLSRSVASTLSSLLSPDRLAESRSICCLYNSAFFCFSALPASSSSPVPSSTANAAFWPKSELPRLSNDTEFLAASSCSSVHSRTFFSTTLIPSTARLQSGFLACTVRPSAWMDDTTCRIFFSSYRSGVPNISNSFMPKARAAFKKLAIFSIFLKGILDLLIRFTEPGAISLISMQSSTPSFMLSTQSSDANSSPVRDSIQSRASSCRRFSSSSRSNSSPMAVRTAGGGLGCGDLEGGRERASQLPGSPSTPLPHPAPLPGGPEKPRAE